MVWLILNIICGAGLFVMFKVFDRTRTPLLAAVVVNYMIAAVCGFCVEGGIHFATIWHAKWLWCAIVLGVLFIVMFLVLGLSSQKAGLSVSAVAGKMSMIIPMTFAIVAYNEQLSAIKIIAMLLALAAVMMCVVKKNHTKTTTKAAMLLPILLFLGMGFDDALVIYAKENFVTSSLSSLFTASLFCFSLLAGLACMCAKPKIFNDLRNYKTWLGGSILGGFNFGSVYFILKALNANIFPNSVVYAIINICIVLISSLCGLLIFHEKLSLTNKAGIAVAIAAIVMFSFV